MLAKWDYEYSKPLPLINTVYTSFTVIRSSDSPSPIHPLLSATTPSPLLPSPLSPFTFFPLSYSLPPFTFSPSPHLLSPLPYPFSPLYLLSSTSPPFTLSLFPFISSLLHLTPFPLLPSLFLPFTIFPKLHPLPPSTFSPQPHHPPPFYLLPSFYFLESRSLTIFWKIWFVNLTFFYYLTCNRKIWIICLNYSIFHPHFIFLVYSQ